MIPNFVQTKHEVKFCEKCAAPFECKMGDPYRCQCSEITLSPQIRDFLEQTDFDCLCKNCLTDLNQKLKNLENHAFPDNQNLIENFHYYRENGLWVFAENYHLLRGYCCRSGCRHCPYGFKKD
jgi:hypothetical protein